MPIQFSQSIGTGLNLFGDVRYVDVNGDGVVDAKDIQSIMETLTQILLFFTNTFAIKI